MDILILKEGYTISTTIIAILVFLTLVSAVIFRYNDRFNYYFAGVLIFLALGLVCELLRIFASYDMQHKEQLELCARLFSALSFRLSPYFALLSALEMAAQWDKDTKNQLYIVLFIPIIINFILDFVYPDFGFLKVFLDKSSSFWTTVIWGAPYVVIANLLIFLSYVKEQSYLLKRQKLLICIFMMPTLFLAVSGFIIPLMYNMLNFNLNTLFMSMFILLFLFFSIRFGFMGAKITLQKQVFDASIGTMSDSLVLLHLIKNELLNVSINAQLLLCDERDEAKKAIQQSSDNALIVMQRITANLQKVNIIKKIDDIGLLIKEVLEEMKPHISNKDIKIINQMNKSEIKYDYVYLKEALLNIIKNSIEAIDDNGTITIFQRSSKKYIDIVIKDNGRGIPKDKLQNVINPFYTTKKNSKQNYGLGLYSSYQIAVKHGGILEIYSEEGYGTTVVIKLPRK